MFDCTTCGEVLKSAILLAQHQYIEHITSKNSPSLVKSVKMSTSSKATSIPAPSHRSSRAACNTKRNASRQNTTSALISSPSLRTQTTSQHEPMAKEPRWPCVDCDATYLSKKGMQRHAREKHGRMISRPRVEPTFDAVYYRTRIHKCDQCPKGFPHRSRLTAHMTRDHPAPPLARGTKLMFSPISIKPENLRLVQSSEAKPRAENDVHLSRQSLTVKHEQKMIARPQRTFPGRYKCEVCHRAFGRADNLQRHYQLVHGGTVGGGVVCKTGKNVTDILARKRPTDDLSRRTTKRKLYKCSKCYMSFAYNYGLQRHASAMHDVDVPDLRMQRRSATYYSTRKHHCDRCAVAFSRFPQFRKHSLHVHGVVANAVRPPTVNRNSTAGAIPPAAPRPRPYKCKYCEKTYTSNRLMYNHRSEKHTIDRVTGECVARIYVCQPCDKTYTSPTGLRKHISLNHGGTSRSSDRNRCTICGHCFPSANQLYQHRHYKHGIKARQPMTNAERRSFKCEECRKSFATSHRLFQHRYIVHKERPKLRIWKTEMKVEMKPERKGDGK